MEQHHIERIEREGLGKVVEVMHTATIMHDGWESDNRGWIVRMDDGEVRGFTTSHNSLIEWERETILKDIKRHREALESLEQALPFLS